VRAVVQRVSSARVEVAGEIVGSIGKGLLAFVGVARDDVDDDARTTASKISGLRVFNDDDGAMNRSLLEAGGSILAVSQFTLYGDVRKGRRPSFVDAAPSESAQALFDRVVELLRRDGIAVETGVFGASMQVELTNDGPVTILIDSRKTF